MSNRQGADLAERDARGPARSGVDEAHRRTLDEKVLCYGASDYPAAQNDGVEVTSGRLHPLNMAPRGASR